MSKLEDAPVIAMTLHQLQRLVSGYYDIDHCDTLDKVAGLIVQSAELCPCEECAETVRALASYSPNSSPSKSASSSSIGR